MSAYIAIYILQIVTMAIASYADIKRRELPIYLLVANIVITLLLLTLLEDAIVFNIIAGILYFLLFLGGTLYFEFGGGDAIMMGMVGLSLGLYGTAICVGIAALILCIYCIALWLLQKSTQKIIPLAPYIFAGEIIYLAGKLIFAI